MRLYKNFEIPIRKFNRKTPAKTIRLTGVFQNKKTPARGNL
ncbi:hypothetical protein KsCSTR_07730 [Candidatus Kuenenia stuttgartiensis]|jgi:hypothetical protein|uniref:Uncharacterized protein n=1 Tax=Kuenenia stuttgartiensis TaxID=174633 RepID=A0A6G7GLB8_KUEST|nr:hypothetical protein KsCSTR_07730 [Candidatus Kuenenia stuttgartiensis]